MHVYEVLRRPVITEKNSMLSAQNKYAFEVRQDANKSQIREAVEKAFKVKVASVNVIRVPGKMRRDRRLSFSRESKHKLVRFTKGAHFGTQSVSPYLTRSKG
jgi:large subunit ribosomal protein L23